jgi:hypothetical protein
MGYHGRPNCLHLDNWKRCRIHQPMGWWWSLLAGTDRPPCVLDIWPGELGPRDGQIECRDQKPFPRPAPPRGGSAAIPPSRDD